MVFYRFRKILCKLLNADPDPCKLPAPVGAHSQNDTGASRFAPLYDAALVTLAHLQVSADDIGRTPRRNALRQGRLPQIVQRGARRDRLRIELELNHCRLVRCQRRVMRPEKVESI